MRVRAFVGLTILAAATAAATDLPYTDEVAKWRVDRENRLRGDAGWLTVVGLSWLKEGTNTFGSEPGSDVVLPRPAPPRAGVLELSKGRITVRAEPNAGFVAQDKPVTTMELRPDTAPGGPDTLVLGPVSFHVIERGGRFAVRVKDKESVRRRQFTGLKWYPVQEGYRVTARFVPHPEPRKVPIANVLGQVEQMASPGVAVFTLNGVEHRLEPVFEAPDAKQLFFIFKDKTAGRDTYPAGRFLYSPMPEDGKVVLDFNKAYSPPCAFTDFATCPLPPKQNRLAARIEAGEKRPPGH